MKSGDQVIARDRVIGKAKAFFSTVRGALHEIFDESAYNRFLQRTKTGRTKQSYRAFLRESESAIAQKPRCC